MKDKRHLIVVDPTAFGGGSKVATETILALLNKQQVRITVLSADKDSWKGPQIQSMDLTRVQLYEPKWLAEKEQGLSYFARHFFIAFNLLLVSLRFGRFDIALGASGPGVDLALYLLRPMMNYKIIQLIHGPVAKSRTIARCLKVAHKVFYLQTSYISLKNALATLPAFNGSLPTNFHLFQNGLSKKQWPTACQKKYASFFWAASLLKWKGLDLFLAALNTMPLADQCPSHICYIKPKGVQLPVTNAPVQLAKVNWHNHPNNLDQLRANSNIFISTSQHEPFGLSILEAMAAGQSIVIPADGAYWDQVLTDNVNCIKYTPGDSQDLSNKLLNLSCNLPLITRLGEQAQLVAQDYQAEKQYAQIVNQLMQILGLHGASSGLARSAI